MQCTEITGKYTNAIVYANYDRLEDSAKEKIQKVCNLPQFENANIRIMPDVHDGAGCVIGFTMTVTDKVVPNLVGVDIGCGLAALEIEMDGELTEEQLIAIDKRIKELVPMGFNVHDTVSYWIMENVLPKFNYSIYDQAKIHHYAKSLGTLGGGNHFIEIAKSTVQNKYFIIVHSGSRKLGLDTANFYQHMAAEQESRRRGEYDKYSSMDYKDAKKIYDPDGLAYLEGDLMDMYLEDLRLCQSFASHNRLVILRKCMEAFEEYVKVKAFYEIGETVHNYIDDKNVLRKGAISTEENSMVLIPINMRDGSLLCLGLGNPEYNCSGPHGAGRLCSRSEAMKTFSMDEYKESMKGIVSSSISEDTIDECPMAYKPIEEIMEYIEPTAKLLDRLIPVLNIKAQESGHHKKKTKRLEDK